MSTGNISRPSSRSQKSSSASNSITRRFEPPIHNPHPPSRYAFTPENREKAFQPCAATPERLLYAQRNEILVLHHQSLAIESRINLHLEDVVWIEVDNASQPPFEERQAVSFDVGRTGIVWRIHNEVKREVARFSAYHHMRVASFMRDGKVACGDDHGRITIFTPWNGENKFRQTLPEPITALAPGNEDGTYAIGYQNGTILIASIMPSFRILHTLSINRAPSPISGLAWHGSSSKAKTDMLATQTRDGDLRVWSVPKAPQSDFPTIIRVLQRSDVPLAGPSWFAWSKNGRLVQLVEDEVRAWDVRTKKVTYDVMPTIDSIVGICNYGPKAALFTLGRNDTIQQYDITPDPSSPPRQVASAQHVPSNTPPTPPISLEDRVRSATSERSDSVALTTETESSADEGAVLSSRIAREHETLEALQARLDREEALDTVSDSLPSQTGSVSSRSSGKAPRRIHPKYSWEPSSSRVSTNTSQEGTEFSFGASSRKGHGSIKSISSFASGPGRGRSSNLRKEVTRSSSLDLFPVIRARLKEVAMRTPHYGEMVRTPDLLRREMLSVVFGWNEDIRSLIQLEISKHRSDSTRGNLLSKWLGDVAPDAMASSIKPQTMTDSDWMMLALSSIGPEMKNQVGEAFVMRPLESGDVHPAVAILLGLGQANEAIEIYVSRDYHMEAVLLTCLAYPDDWRRISHLLRAMGQQAVNDRDAELAARCFSCNSVETPASWSSPRAQEAVFRAQQEQFGQPRSAGPVTSPTLSTGSARKTIKNAQLRLTTTFNGDRTAPMPTNNNDPLTILEPNTATNFTPILNSARPFSPGGLDPSRLRKDRMGREPSSARTATPGGRKSRGPSRSDIERLRKETAEMVATPITAARDFAPATALRTASRTSNRTSNSKTSNSRRTSSVNNFPEPNTVIEPSSAVDFETLAPRTFGGDDTHLPSPAQGVFTRLGEEHRARNMSKERNLTVEVVNTAFTSAPETGSSLNSPQAALKSGTLSPPLTGGSSKASTRSRRGDHIDSVKEARVVASLERAEGRARGESRKRGESRGERASSRRRDASESRGRGNVRYIKPAKRSPTSPVPMSPREIANANQSQTIEAATTDDENFYKSAPTSAVGSHFSGQSGQFARSEAAWSRRKESLGATSDVPIPSVVSARFGSDDRLSAADAEGRGRSDKRHVGSASRSPSLPLALLSDKRFSGEENETQSDGHRYRHRSKSGTRRVGNDGQSEAQTAYNRRDRSTSRKPSLRDYPSVVTSDFDQPLILDGKASDLSYASTSSISLDGRRRHRDMSRKELAAIELEERRRSLARRPSAPLIPLPSDLSAATSPTRPQIGQRSYTELGDSPTSFMPPMSRSHTVDPDSMTKYNLSSRGTGVSTPSALIGLPATPRAMRHPRYMTSDQDEQLPPIPDIPDKFSDLGSFYGSSLSGPTNSNMSDVASSLFSSQQQKSSVMSSVPSTLSETDDSVGPLLPSTVFGQKVNQRSASAPPDHMDSIPAYHAPAVNSSSRRLSHVRKISPPELTTDFPEGPDAIASIDAALHGSANSDAQVIIIPESQEELPAILPELQHLAMPPPPPPPPAWPRMSAVSASGVINIAIDDKSPTSAVDGRAPQLPLPMDRASTTSPSSHRRNAPSGSGETFGARIRGLGDRMRSSSKNRTKSPQLEYKPAPYESVQPPASVGRPRGESLTQRAQSPYEQAMAAQNQPGLPSDMKLNETSIPPSSLPGSRSNTANGYRHPKEVRANMPPETLQQGVFTGNGGFL